VDRPPLRDEAGLRGLTVVDCGTARRHPADRTGQGQYRRFPVLYRNDLLHDVHKDVARLVGEIPAKITVSGIQRTW
jgi:flagellar biosynthesis protein FlhA